MQGKDIAGMQFGYLEALEPSGKRNRKGRYWICRCKCGKVVELPASRLLTGNTRSCGCMLADHLQKVNLYYEGTSIRQAMEVRERSVKAKSGYTGVTLRRGKWMAYVKYKGKMYNLGRYDALEDAVEARTRGKQLVRENAADLLLRYQQKN